MRTSWTTMCALVAVGVCAGSVAALESASGITPGRRSGHSMVHDEARGTVLLFGGTVAGDPAAAAATYAFDGGSWKRVAEGGPAPRSDAKLAYDAARGVVVLHGGRQWTSSGMRMLTDTWEWDGRTWRERSTSGPPERMHAGLGYDPASRRVLLYGGFGAGDAILRDTWAWNGTEWQRVDVAGPEGRSVNAMTVLDGTLMLATGYNAPGTTRDGNMGLELWAWRDGSWEATPNRAVRFSPEAPMTATGRAGELLLFAGWDAPPARHAATWLIDPAGARSVGGTQPERRRGSAAAYDARRGRVVLYGGEAEAGLLADTWEFAGGEWQQVAEPAAWPAARSYHAAAYDSHRDRLLVYGGNGPSGSYVDTTGAVWEWDGEAWQGIAAPGPGPRDDVALVYDPVNRRTLLFGGRHGDTYHDDLWAWQAGVWTRLAANGPGPRHLMAAALDSARGELVLHGGHAMPNGSIRGDTWTWGRDGWQQRAGDDMPPRFAHGMTWDASSQSVVLFGGILESGPSGDTWRWNGSRWERLHAAGPAAAGLHAFAAAGAGRLLLVHGTLDPGPEPLLLRAFSSGEWRDSVPGPSWRTGYAVAFDARRGRLLLFGGGVRPAEKLDELWQFDADGWRQLPRSTGARPDDDA